MSYEPTSSHRSQPKSSRPRVTFTQILGRALFSLIGLGSIGISVNLLLVESQVVSAIIALLLGVVFCFRAITGQFYLGRGMRPPHSF